MNDMFQKLYADATDDQRKAMIKSYQESNGTALSTDWSDVSKVKPSYFTSLCQFGCLADNVRSFRRTHDHRRRRLLTLPM